ncbi:MAG: PAS domain-containing protein [Thiobacillus sp.]|nr:PAS domain-containing protein [Thiobacillus sp.]
MGALNVHGHEPHVFGLETYLGKNAHRLIHHIYPDGRPHPKEDCHIRQGKPTHVGSEVHWRKDCSSFLVEYCSHPVYRNGELVGTVINFLDIGERKRQPGLKTPRRDSRCGCPGSILKASFLEEQPCVTNTKVCCMPFLKVP